MKLVVAENESSTDTPTNYPDSSMSSSSVAIAPEEEKKIQEKKRLNRLKKLKVIQEKADANTYGGTRERFMNKRGHIRPLKPTMRKQHR